MRTMCAAVMLAAGLAMPAWADEAELKLGAAEVVAADDDMKGDD